jgi:hypothetical protein
MLNFEKTINLTTSLHNTITSFYAPLSLTINPSSLIVSKKIYKIEYIFDDEIKTQTLFYKLSTTETLPFSAEIGDPRNYKCNKTFYITSTATSQVFGISANVYQLGVTNPTKIQFKLNLNAPIMDGTDENAFFDSVQLLYTRMFGVNNDVLYVFESVNPNYYIPVVVNWNNKPVIEPIVDLSSKSRRAYNILKPFQNQNVENPYNIDFVDKQKEIENDPNYPDCK